MRERRKIGAALAARDEKIQLHAEIAYTTSELRDTLADLLMTGNLPVNP